MYTPEDFVKRLDEFKSADEIAAQFAILGLKGRGRASNNCPLATLGQQVLGQAKLEIGFSYLLCPYPTTLDLPHAASAFAIAITVFRKYPELLNHGSTQ